MSLRTNLITGEPILFAPDRAARPHAFGRAAAYERCPFCAGNEEETPPELVRRGDPWHIRAFPNKYPPVDGAEVLVESPRHDATFGDIEHAGDAVRIYIDRYRTHADAAYVALFKNAGVLAGASIAHIHSQLLPLPFVPPRVERETNGFTRAAVCPLCVAVESHRRDDLVIRETSQFAWLAPSASWMPWQQWIVPKRHCAEITEIDGEEIGELADLLQASATAMQKIADAYNWTFMNFPRTPSAHWYVDLYPRLTPIAGLELGTGTFVEIIDPAAAARQFGR